MFNLNVLCVCFTCIMEKMKVSYVLYNDVSLCPSDVFHVDYFLFLGLQYLYVQYVED